MPLPLPILDDRTFEDLVAEARVMIPRLAPEWTNHNPSDPGITLIELFAWLSEMMLYRLNLITEKHYEVFLQLLGVKPESGESTQAAVARALRSLQSRSRAVSLDDFEQLALQFPDPKGPARTRIVRAKALAPLNLEHTSPTDAGHVSIVILPERTAVGLSADAGLATTVQTLSADPLNPLLPVNILRRGVATYLQPYRLLTTVVHVVPPRFQNVRMKVRVAGRTGVVLTRLRENVEQQLQDFLDPYPGEGREGWPFGLALRRFEVLQHIEAIEDVDHVESLLLNDSAQTNEIALEGDQLLNLTNITVESI